MIEKRKAPEDLLQKVSGANVLLEQLHRKDIDIFQYNKELDIILSNSFIEYHKYHANKALKGDYCPHTSGNRSTVKSLLFDGTNGNYLAFSWWGDVFIWVDGARTPMFQYTKWNAMYYSRMYRKAAILMLIEPKEVKRWGDVLERYPTTRKRIKLIDIQTFKSLYYA